MFTPFEFVNSILGNTYVLLTVIFASLLCKAVLLFVCMRYSLKAQVNHLLFILPMLFLAGAILDDAWYMTSLIIRKVLEISGDIPNYTLFFRIDWIFFITQYQALALFLEYLISKKIRINFIAILHIFFNIILSSAFAYLAIFKYSEPASNPDIQLFEIKLIQAAYLYLPFLFIPLFYKLFKKTKEMPLILAKQVSSLTRFFIPYLVLETVNNCNSYMGFLIPLFSIHKYSFFTLTTVLVTYAMYYMSKSIIGLRFLNIRKSVESKEHFNFLARFRDILVQLSYATAVQEISTLTQLFFQMAFAIPISQVRFYVREGELSKSSGIPIDGVMVQVEHFIQKPEHAQAIAVLDSLKIFIRDEIEFSHFYEENPSLKAALDFLNAINADIFLPVYERNTIVAYVIVERNARSAKLFTTKDRDEMLVFVSYLNNIINILKYSHVDAIQGQHKELMDELYFQHQQNNQYKESIRSFMRSGKERKVGVVFYKHRKFTIANEAAQELIGFDLNSNPGDSLTQAFKAVARKVLEFKTAQSSYIDDNKGNKLVISGIPSLEDYTVILHIYYPEISDVIKAQFDQLKDPSAWDYILYLETTQSGKMVNQLLPGSGATLLNFKIKLLKMSLNKKALHIDMRQDDVANVVEIIHHISLRETLHKLHLAGPERDNEIGSMLFGLNPLLENNATQGLLEKLTPTGTLFIQNIEYLSLATQQKLAECIAHGAFYKYKSDQKVAVDVRILCSTNKDLSSLVQEGRFSKTLFNELNKTALHLPALHTLPWEEISDLAQGFAQQMQHSEVFKNLLALTEKDKIKVLQELPLSMNELKDKVRQLLVQKSNRHNIHDITDFDPLYHGAEPELAQAARLGKKALKDPQIMSMLWNKFKSQAKIATILGVNRSSVNRRCQEYKLE